MTTHNLTADELKSHLRTLGLYGLLARWDDVRERSLTDPLILLNDFGN